MASLDVIPAVSVTELTKFQFASTAFTVTEKDAPAVCVEGVPVFPLPVPGSVVSPGISSCNFEKAPAFMVMEGVVLAVFAGSV